MFWKIAKSSNKVHYERRKKEMQESDASACNWLKKKDPKYFVRVHFSTFTKCNSVDNNIYEIFNGIIIAVGFKHIMSMLKEIYNKIMERVGYRVKAGC